MEREYDQREALYANQIAAAETRSGDIGAINDHLDTLSAQIARAHDAMTRLEGL